MDAKTKVKASDKQKEFQRMRKAVKKFLSTVCPNGTEIAYVDTLEILVYDDCWKVYWDDGHYMVFTKNAGKPYGGTGFRELTAIYRLLSPAL